MRGTLWLAVLLPGLAGCVPPPMATTEEADGVIPMTLRRRPDTIAFATAPERECSLLRLATGGAFCRPVEPPPAAPPYCTRSLAGVDCWNVVDPFGTHQREVADGPRTLSWVQEHDRTGRWQPPASVEAAGPEFEIYLKPRPAPP